MSNSKIKSKFLLSILMILAFMFVGSGLLFLNPQTTTVYATDEDDITFTKVTDASQITAENIGTCTAEEAKAWILANWDEVNDDVNEGCYADIAFYLNTGELIIVWFDSSANEYNFSKFFHDYINTTSSISDLQEWFGSGDSVFICTANPTYAQYKNTTTVIKFDDKDWYLIDYDDSTVTLLSKECVGASRFGSENTYAGSTVETAVNNYYAESISTGAKTAVSNNKMFLLSTDEAEIIYNANPDVLKCSKPSDAEDNVWWLCSQGYDYYYAAGVYGEDGEVDEDGYNLSYEYGVRPALKLDLSKVTFSSESNTFSLKTAGYDVTITAGDNMTTTGNASQTDLSGAMTDVVYTAADGYYFPENYSIDAVNGIEVTRNSYTQITVHGTPTANAEITLIAPTQKTTPDAPTVAATVNCTTADNNNGKLTGISTAMEYKKSDAENWTNGTGSDITGLVPGTYYVRYKATDTAYASANQELTIVDYNTATANTVKEKIAAIGTVEYTTESKGKIDEARAAYNALTADQKALVTNYETLTTAEAEYKTLDDNAKADEVKAKIAVIGTVEYTADSKTKIDTARNAYNALTDDQKALVDTYETLTTAESTYATLKADNDAADEVKAKIAAIGTVEYTAENKAKIDEAREAYNALTDDQKALVDTYETLTTAESTYATLKANNDAADEVKAKIAAIGTVEYTADSKTKIDEAREAYNALTPEQKALVTNYETLTTAEAEYKTLDDNAKADEVKAKIAAIGTVEYTAENKAKIDEAREAYNALTDEQKALVDTYATLTTAESDYATLKAESEAPKGLSAGAVVAIVLSSVVALGVGGFAIYWFVIKKKTWAEFVQTTKNVCNKMFKKNK